MKTKFTTFGTLALATGLHLFASQLTETTAVHIRPDENSPAISFLKAGTAPTFAPDFSPSGWVAVELPGPFEGYVQNKDIEKSLDVSPGAAIYLKPENSSPVLGQKEEGDRAVITGLHGKWTQVRLEKKITGYIRVAGNSAPALSPQILTDVSTVAPAPAPSPAPVAPVAYGVSTAGQPAPTVNLGNGGAGALPRLFQGKFVSSRRPFTPRRPYDWQLNDDAGVRYAYLDVTKLLLTEQIEKYANHMVVVFGTPKPMPGGQDIVLAVESLRLK